MSVKHDGGKLRPSLLPVVGLRAIQEALEFGAIKYTVGGWKDVPGALLRYTDAMVRHAEEVLESIQEDGHPFRRDKESGCLHLAHVGCNAVFLIYLHNRKRKRCKKKKKKKK